MIAGRYRSTDHELFSVSHKYHINCGQYTTWQKGGLQCGGYFVWPLGSEVCTYTKFSEPWVMYKKGREGPQGWRDHSSVDMRVAKAPPSQHSHQVRHNSDDDECENCIGRACLCCCIAIIVVIIASVVLAYFFGLI